VGGIRRVAIIGLGPHNRRIYYPQLEQRGISVALVIDVESERAALLDFLRGRWRMNIFYRIIFISFSASCGVLPLLFSVVSCSQRQWASRPAC
jgi:hypothetical protein